MWKRTVSIAAGLILLTSCDEEATSPELPVATDEPHLTIVSGNEQTGTSGKALPGRLVIAVRDGAGLPMAGQEVTWRVMKGEGSISPLRGFTNSDGRASASWKLGTIVGDRMQAAEVSAAGSPRARAIFVASARCDSAADNPGRPPVATAIVPENWC